MTHFIPLLLCMLLMIPGNHHRRIPQLLLRGGMLHRHQAMPHRLIRRFADRPHCRYSPVMTVSRQTPRSVCFFVFRPPAKTFSPSWIHFTNKIRRENNDKNFGNVSNTYYTMEKKQMLIES